jgi:hypothetical protein
MAKDSLGNVLQQGDAVAVSGTVDLGTTPPVGDNVRVTITFTIANPDGSISSVDLWSGQLVRLGSAPAPTPAAAMAHPSPAHPTHPTPRR